MHPEPFLCKVRVSSRPPYNTDQQNYLKCCSFGHTLSCTYMKQMLWLLSLDNLRHSNSMWESTWPPKLSLREYCNYRVNFTSPKREFPIVVKGNIVINFWFHGGDYENTKCFDFSGLFHNITAWNHPHPFLLKYDGLLIRFTMAHQWCVWRVSHFFRKIMVLSG